MGGVELRQLEYFVAVAEHLHFGRAAEQLSIGQPAVSQQIARLERELGVSLFDRSARTVRLTSAGETFLPEARAVLTAAKQAVQSVSARTGAPTLRIGSSTGLGARLNRVLQALREIQPATETLLVSAPTQVRLERVARGQLDAAFVRGVTSAPGVELIDVWRDRLLVALPAKHELAGAETIAIADLANTALRITARRHNPPLVDLVMRTCADAGFNPVLGSTSEGLDNMLAAIATGPPSWTVVYESHAKILQLPDVAFVPTTPALSMATAVAVRADATSRTVAPLLRACAAAAADDQFS